MRCIPFLPPGFVVATKVEGGPLFALRRKGHFRISVVSSSIFTVDWFSSCSKKGGHLLPSGNPPEKGCLRPTPM